MHKVQMAPDGLEIQFYRESDGLQQQQYILLTSGTLVQVIEEFPGKPEMEDVIGAAYQAKADDDAHYAHLKEVAEHVELRSQQVTKKKPYMVDLREEEVPTYVAQRILEGLSSVDLFEELMRRADFREKQGNHA